MKKVLMWTLYFLALAATALCFIFPVQAKEVCDNIMNVLNTPIAIAGVSVTLGGLLSFVVSKYIMTNTKFGRKELDSLKEDFKETENEVTEYKEKIDNRVAEIENKYASLENNCENKVTIMLEEFEDMQNTVINGLKTIPNKKIQAIVEEYETKYAERKEEIIEKTINTNDYIDKKLLEMFQEFMEKVKYEETVNNEAEAE